MSRDEGPLTRKLGYAEMLEKAAIRQRLLAAGMTDAVELHFRTEDEYLVAHANDRPYREASRDFLAKMAARSESSTFTADQLRRIIEHFEDANDPELLEIAATAKRVLGTIV